MSAPQSLFCAERSNRGRRNRHIKKGGGMCKFSVLLLAGVIFLAGCTTITGYHKSVTVEKDKDGNIVKTTVVEEINQPNLQKEVQQFKYLNQ
jgi:hypothetical protein